MAIITFSLSHYTLCILIYVWGQFTIITSCKPLESRQIKLFKKHKGLSDLMTGENRHLILISVGLMFTESYYIYVGKTRKTFFNFCSSIITHFSDISEKAKKKKRKEKLPSSRETLWALSTSVSLRAELKLPPTVSHKINYDNAFLYPFVIVMNGCLSGGKNTQNTEGDRETHFSLSLCLCGCNRGIVRRS